MFSRKISFATVIKFINMIGLYIRSSEKLDLIEEKDAFVSNIKGYLSD